MPSDTTMKLLEAREKLELHLKKEKLVRENGIRFYKPHPKQDLFHRNALYKRRYARTGNRFGKSDMGAAEDVAFALGERPWYPEGDPRRTIGIPKHSTRGCIVVQSWEKAHEIFTCQEEGQSMGKLFKLIPHKDLVDTRKSRSGGGIGEIVIKSIHGGNSTIRIQTVRSFILNPLSMESSDWDWIHVDEPCPELMWAALARGLTDRGGAAWFTCTPLTEPWINDYFIPNDRIRATFEEGYVNENKKIPRFILTGSIRDNIYLKPEDIDAFLDDIPEEQRKCRESGIPLTMEGLIYKQFDHNLHVYRKTPFGWKSPINPPDNYTIRAQIDPHPKTPSAILYFATSPQGYTYIYKEYYLPSLAKDLVEEIQAEQMVREMTELEMDPLGWSTDPVHDTCIADEFLDAEIDVNPSPKQLAFGIIKTQEKLAERTDSGHPTIFVHEDCERFLFEVNRYIWKPLHEKPVDKDDHMMECLYRGVLFPLEHLDPEPYQLNIKPLSITEDSWQDCSSVIEYSDDLYDY